MPTSPTPAEQSGPAKKASGAAESGSGTHLRSQPAGEQAQRPGEKRAREEDGEDLTGVVVRIGEGARPKTLARLRSTEPPTTAESGGKDLPSVFQAVLEKATGDAPIGVSEGGAPVVASGGGVLVTQDCGGRGPGPNPTGQREPDGRDSHRQSLSQTRRGPKKTAHQRRYAASRPSGFHPQLNAWDLTPIEVRSSAAGQERAIFQARGLLVCHFDFQLYRAMYSFNVGEIHKLFPLAPQWWPTDWGRIPITLPWELSMYRTLLVSADPDDPLWKEVYQKFLEQLAGGWDLYYKQTYEKSLLVGVSPSLAQELIDSGAFAFCAGRSPSASFKKFCELHSIMVEGLPDQRLSKHAAWDRIRELRKKQEAEKERKATASGPVSCQCQARMFRAARRLGLEAQTLEVAPRGPPLDAMETVERLTSLASAAMTYSINTAQMLERMEEQLSVARRDSYSRSVEDAHAAIRNAPELSEFLPRRFEANLSRLGPSS